MKLITRFELASRSDSELHAQRRESFQRWTFWLAVIWIILIDEARERERKHKRRLATQRELNRQEEDRRARRKRNCPAPKPPTP